LIVWFLTRFLCDKGEQRKAISILKDELQDRKGSTSTDARFQRKESHAIVSATWRDFQLKQSVLATKLRNLEDKLKTETIVNGETKAFLTKKHGHLMVVFMSVPLLNCCDFVSEPR
jgi:hypothetical protein